MIDTRTVKDISGMVDLCETFTYEEILSFDVGVNKKIKYILPSIELKDEYIVEFTDGTIFTFTSEKQVSHIEIINNTLLVYAGQMVLKQIETGVVYGNSVIDVLAGYKDDKPYSRFTYIEVENLK